MRTWKEIPQVFRQAVIMVLCEELEVHRNYAMMSSHTPVGHLVQLQARQQLMSDALVIAVDVLHNDSLEVSTEWLCVDPAQRELVFARLLDTFRQCKRRSGEIAGFGLPLAAARTDELAEAAYVAAVTLGYEAP